MGIAKLSAVKTPINSFPLFDVFISFSSVDCILFSSGASSQKLRYSKQKQSATTTTSSSAPVILRREYANCPSVESHDAVKNLNVPKVVTVKKQFVTG